MRKALCFLTALLLFALCIPTAFAVSYPDKQGNVLDTAGVVGSQTAADIATLSERLKDACGGQVYVVTRHFLGGMDASTYAQGLFSSWNLSDNDALLLMVIGEETYALQCGSQAKKALQGESGSVLLGSYFRTPYLNRQYDEAIAAFLPQVAQKIAKYKNQSVSTAGLFGAASVQSTPAPSNGVFNWSGFITSGDVDWKDYSGTTVKTKEQEVEKSTGFSFKKLLIIALIGYFLFGRKASRNKYNFRHPPRR